MKKLMLIVALLVSLGLVAGVFAEPASAFFKSGGPFGFFGAKSNCVPAYAVPCAPYYCAPYFYGCPPYACKPRKGKGMKAKGKAPAMKQKPPKAEKKMK